MAIGIYPPSLLAQSWHSHHNKCCHLSGVHHGKMKLNLKELKANCIECLYTPEIRRCFTGINTCWQHISSPISRTKLKPYFHGVQTLIAICSCKQRTTNSPAAFSWSSFTFMWIPKMYQLKGASEFNSEHRQEFICQEERQSIL